MLGIEFKRALRRNSVMIVFIIGILTGLLEALSNNVIKLPKDAFYNYPFGVYSQWFLFNINMYTGIFSIIFPLLGSIAYSDAYVEDIKSGFIKNIITKYDKSKYLITRFFVNFIIGGICVSLPLVVNLVAYLLLIPSIEPNIFFGTNIVSGHGFLPNLYFTYPIVYIFLRIAIFFMYGGAFASVGLAFGVLVKNRYVVVIIPFISYILLDIFFSTIKKFNLSPVVFLFQDKPYNHIIPSLGLIITVLAFMLFFFGGRYNETV